MVMHYTNHKEKEFTRKRVICKTEGWSQSTNHWPSVTCKRCLKLLGLSKDYAEKKVNP